MAIPKHVRSNELKILILFALSPSPSITRRWIMNCWLKTGGDNSNFTSISETFKLLYFPLQKKCVCGRRGRMILMRDSFAYLNFITFFWSNIYLLFFSFLYALLRHEQHASCISCLENRLEKIYEPKPESKKKNKESSHDHHTILADFFRSFFSLLPFCSV